MWMLVDPRARQVLGRQRAHGAGADDDRGAAGQRAELGFGHPECHRHHRGACGVDAGLGVHPLADRQRALRQLVQGAADGVVGLRGGIRAADLPEHLLFADHRGIQPAGHREEVLDGRLGIAHVGVLGQVVQATCRNARRAPARSPTTRRGMHRRRRRPRHDCRWTAPLPRSRAKIAAPGRRSWPDRPRRCSTAPEPTPARFGVKPRKATRSRLHHHVIHGSRLPVRSPNFAEQT